MNNKTVPAKNILIHGIYINAKITNSRYFSENNIPLIFFVKLNKKRK